MSQVQPGGPTAGGTAGTAGTMYGAPAAPVAEGNREADRAAEVPLGNGAIIALVGPDAAGKTTVARFLMDWLGARASAEYVHLNTPPRTARTRALRLVYRAWRRIAHAIARPRAAAQASDGGAALPALCAVIDAMERSAAVQRCALQAARGVVVVTDRYPTRVAGAATGPRVPVDHGSGVVRALARLERRLYARVRQPDVVIRVEVPEEESVRRNAARPAPKPEAMIHRSHDEARRISFPGVPSLLVDNTRPIEEVQREVLAFVHRTLAETGRAGPAAVARGPVGGVVPPRAAP